MIWKMIYLLLLLILFRSIAFLSIEGNSVLLLSVFIGLVLTIIRYWTKRRSNSSVDASQFIQFR